MLGYSPVGKVVLGASGSSFAPVQPPLGIDASKVAPSRTVKFAGGKRVVIFSGGVRVATFNGGKRTVRF